MAYDGKIMRRASQRFEEDRRRRQEEFRLRTEAVYRREPRLREVQRELNATMSKIIAGALRQGTDPRPAIEGLKNRNLSLQEERASLLKGLGLPPDYLEEKPSCPLCGDTGRRGEAVCRCLRRYYAQEQQRELSRMLDLGSQSFDTFSLDWYSTQEIPQTGISPRKNMERNRDICVDYAYDFNEKSGNLLLTGAPGLGKTFLSACIARVVSEKGCSVVYDTAAHIFQRFEVQKFGREEDEEASDDVTRVLNCDLLILDDLGTELTTNFVQSTFYEIVNTRLMGRKSTIISTNLSVEDLSRRYYQQVASRIEGEYQILLFFGQDIRKLKKERQ